MSIVRMPVVSSNLVSVGYDENGSTLEVEFKSGSVYQYFDVPLWEFENLMSADSIGGYHYENIREAYRYTQL